MTALVVLHKSDHEPHSAAQQKNTEQGMSNLEGTTDFDSEGTTDFQSVDQGRHRRTSSLSYEHNAIPILRFDDARRYGMVLQHSKFLVGYSAVRAPDAAPCQTTCQVVYYNEAIALGAGAGSTIIASFGRGWAPIWNCSGGGSTKSRPPRD